MAWTCQIFRSRLRINESANSSGAIMSRDTRSCPMHSINGSSKCRSLQRTPTIVSQGKPQCIQPLTAQGHTDKTTCLVHDKIDLLWSRKLCGHADVSFIL